MVVLQITPLERTALQLLASGAETHALADFGHSSCADAWHIANHSTDSCRTRCGLVTSSAAGQVRSAI
jgi:hypothetical protein